MVSKVCHSQLSSSTLARAAHMPPWAAPVWERVGYSLGITAVRGRRELSSAARRPAPPAPTITTSKVCCWTVMSYHLRHGTGALGGPWGGASSPHMDRGLRVGRLAAGVIGYALWSRGEGEDRQCAEGPGEADHGGVDALGERRPAAAAGV